MQVEDYVLSKISEKLSSSLYLTLNDVAHMFENDVVSSYKDVKKSVSRSGSKTRIVMTRSCAQCVVDVLEKLAQSYCS